MPGIGPNARALAKSLKAAEIPDSDDAAIQLARRYAALLDGILGDPDAELAAVAKVYSDLGPKYLAALTALGLTKAGRGVNDGKGVAAGATAAVHTLDELRRKHGRTG